MNRYLVIESATGIVRNVIVKEANVPYVVAGMELVDTLAAPPNVSIDWRRSGAQWIAPYDPVPESASPATIRVALRRLHGVTNAQLDATVGAVLASIPNPGERDDAETLWLYSVSIRRDHPLVAAVAVAFNLTDAQTDEVFRVAATI